MAKKLLVAFDFDHTIIDGNSDTIVLQLLETKPAKCTKAECWTTYMQNIFNSMHKEEVEESRLLNTITNILPTPGMIELLQYLNSPDVEVIIISDSNSVFIDAWLVASKLTYLINNVYTNQAFFDSSGLLNISMYQNQNWCNMCPQNLCKGFVLDQHLKRRHEEGVTFSCVAYVGDGNNDFCPSTKLSGMDHIFARKGFSLEKLLGNSQKEEDAKTKILANICVWTSASEIKVKLSEIL